MEPDGSTSSTHSGGRMNVRHKLCPSMWNQWVRDPTQLKLQQRFGLIEGPTCAELYQALSVSRKTEFPSGDAGYIAAKDAAE